MSIDYDAGRLLWQQPDRSSYSPGERPHSILLSEIQSVSIVDAERHIFALAVPRGFYEFRCTCAEALNAWVEALTPFAVAPLASEGGVPLSGGVPLVRSPRASPSKGSTPSK